MIELLNQIGIIFKWFFVDMLGQYIGAKLGLIGDFFSAFGYAKSILIAIATIASGTIIWILRKRRF